MKKILVILALAFSMSASAQLPDETSVAMSGDKAVCITTYSTKVFTSVLQTQDSLLTRSTITYGQDKRRNERYRIYKIYIKAENAQPVINYLKTLK